jgi:hypothetical protein
VNGEPGGLISADQFLQTWVPQITSSPAFQQDVLLIITFDEAEIEVTFVNGQPDHRRRRRRAATSSRVRTRTARSWASSRSDRASSTGRRRHRQVLLSRFISPGTVSNVPTTISTAAEEHRGPVRSGAPGRAAPDGLQGFGGDVFTPTNG